MVLRRASRIRRQRTVTAGLCALALVIGVSGGALLTGNSPTVSLAETTYQFNAQSAPLAAGQSVPTTALVDVIFANARDGFGVVLHRSTFSLAASEDGGSTWRVVDPTLPPDFAATGNAFPGQFEFTSPQVGFLWGGTTSSGPDTAPLWVTRDGGQSWSRAAVGPGVEDVSAIGSDVWVLTTGCQMFPSSISCIDDLEVSHDAGLTWQPGSSPSALRQSKTGQYPDDELARITTLRAYVLEEAVGSTDFALEYTADGGQTWSSRTVPCTAPFDLGAELAASGTNDLWLICGGQAESGIQLKDLYRTDNGGQSWLLASSATGFAGGPPDPDNSPSPLPASGYLAPLSVGHKNLAVLSSTTAWLLPSRGDLLITHDGGYEWTVVPGLGGIAALQYGGAGDVTFISGTRGWVCAYGLGLWQTSDGVHWSVLGQ
jgi:photosystem II stability/assembly factor-like uncharacterized protein